MQIDDVPTFLHQKFQNMCTYLECTYADIDTSDMRKLSPIALYVIVKKYMLPNIELIRLGSVDEFVKSVDEPALAVVAAKCRDDEKLLRYVKMFADLIS